MSGQPPEQDAAGAPGVAPVPEEPSQPAPQTAASDLPDPEATAPDQGSKGAPARGSRPQGSRGPRGPKPPEDLTGRIINNNYRVVRLIGRGGMGEVYEGEHLFTGNRIAIKMVLQSLSRDPQILALFKREARILFQLTDDAIARYLDSVHDPVLDRYCLIMDFIEGIPLADHVKQSGPIPVEAARRLTLRLAGALERAHRLGITHRDLSPDNVMLRGGDVGQAVLIDFGIARSERADDATLHGQLAGKFKFISPEQLGHFNAEIGPRTDVYGLALVLAMALRGTPIDMGNSVVAAVEARRRIPPLDGIPDEIVPLLSHMLEPDPAHRPAGMGEVLALLSDPHRIPAHYQPQGGIADHDRTVLLTRERATAEAPTGPLSSAAAAAQQTILAAPPLMTGRGTPTAQPSDRRTGETLPGGQSTSPPQSSAPFEAGRPITGGQWSNPSGAANPHDATNGGFQGLPPREPAPIGAPVTAAPLGGRQGMRMAGLALVALLAAGGGWWALNRPLPEVPPEPSTTETSAQTPPSGGDSQSAHRPEADPLPMLPPPDPSTREGLLAAELTPALCAYATRITAGANSGRIEVFGTSPEASSGIGARYGAAFGLTPALVNREVTEAQCAALDLVRGLQGRAGVPPLLTLDSDAMASGGSLIGRISETRGRVVWLFLVSASGAVHDLSSRLEAQADGSWLFAIGARSLSGKAEPQLLVTVTTDTALVSAAAAPAGAAAGVLLPAVLAEIARRQTNAGAQMAWFLLTP